MDGQAKWAQNGWRMLACRATMLVYLFYVGEAVAHDEHGAWAVCGFAILIAFAACWLAIPLPGSPQIPWRFWVVYGLLITLFVAELPFAHAQGFVLAVFITVTTVGRLGARATPVALALALAALLVPTAIPSWHVSLAMAWDDVTPAAIPIAALVTFGLRRVLQDSQALAEARAELACLAAENERFRIARDLHDLLGHSLTTITVKAGLAARRSRACPGDPGDDGGGSPGQADNRRRPRHRGQLSRRDAGRGTRQRTAAAAGGRHHGGPSERRGQHGSRSPGAFRLGGARGDHQRRPALPRQLVRGPAVRRIDRDRGRRGRRHRVGRERPDRPA